MPMDVWVQVVIPPTSSLRAAQWVSAKSLQSCLTLTPWTVPHQAPLSMAFPRSESWKGWPCPPPGDRPDPGVEQMRYLLWLLLLVSITRSLRGEILNFTAGLQLCLKGATCLRLVNWRWRAFYGVPPTSPGNDLRVPPVVTRWYCRVYLTLGGRGSPTCCFGLWNILDPCWLRRLKR